MLKVGFLVNPIAGMGGRVGLKGTDGVLEEAKKRGAKPIAHERGTEFLKRLVELEASKEIKFVICPGSMGANLFHSIGQDVEVLPMKLESKTTASDTKKAVQLMVNQGVAIILFVGGDGTARDILDALAHKGSLAVLGIPSGVKMYSGVFAVSPLDAVYVVEAFINGEAQLTDVEVIDVNEDAIRRDAFNIRLYGFLKTPFLPFHVQGSKQSSPETLNELDNQKGVATFVIEEMNSEATYILGPGTTVKAVADLLGVEKTLLGVDIFREGKVLKDVNEEKILREIDDWEKSWIIVSPIGRQGILFGRGNQQISPQVIKLTGKDRVIVVATKSKIRSIQGGVLRVDTGDRKVDRMLSGYVRVVTDYREWRVLKVE